MERPEEVEKQRPTSLFASPAAMGDPSVLVTEESHDASQEAKGMAMEAMSQASVFIKMKEPAAAIRDAKAAPEIDPDSAKGTRLMGWLMLCSASGRKLLVT